MKNAGKMKNIKVELIDQNSQNPRMIFDEKRLADLADDILVRGLFQPILVRPIANGRYEVVAGERRYRASLLAGIVEIPCLIRVLDDRQAFAISCDENLRREDLNPMEEAEAFAKMQDKFKFSHREIAAATGTTHTNVGNRLRLLRLIKPLQELLLQGGVPIKKAEAIANWETDCQFDYLEEICSQNDIDINAIAKLDTARIAISKKAIKKSATKFRDAWSPKMFPDFERESAQRRADRQAIREINDLLESFDAKSETYEIDDITRLTKFLPKSELQRDLIIRRISRVIRFLEELETCFQDPEEEGVA